MPSKGWLAEEGSDGGSYAGPLHEHHGSHWAVADSEEPHTTASLSALSHRGSARASHGRRGLTASTALGSWGAARTHSLGAAGIIAQDVMIDRYEAIVQPLNVVVLFDVGASSAAHCCPRIGIR